MDEKNAGAGAWRVERDSMGEMRVPADALWGAQTERSHENFPIGTERMPQEIVRAFALVKKAAARANCSLGRLAPEACELICEAVGADHAQEILYDNGAAWYLGA